jgi:hypothetical protein
LLAWLRRSREKTNTDTSRSGKALGFSRNRRRGFMPLTAARQRPDLFGDHFEASECALPSGVSIATSVASPARNQDAADERLVMAGISPTIKIERFMITNEAGGQSRSFECTRAGHLAAASESSRYPFWFSVACAHHRL